MAGHSAPLGGYEPQVPVQEGMRRVVPEYRPSNLGGALGQLADTGQAVFEHVQQKDAAAHVATALPLAHVQAAKIFQDAQEQPKDVIDDAGGFTPYIMRQFNAYAQDAIGKAPNKYAQGDMTAELTKLGATTQMRAMQVEAADRIAQRTQTAKDGIEAAAAAVRIDPTSLDYWGKQQTELQNKLGVDQATRQKLGIDTHDALFTAAAIGSADKDPASVLNRLNDASDPLFTHLDTKQREAIQTHAKGKLADNEATGLVNFFRSNGPDAGARALRDFNANPNTPDDVKEQVQQKVQQGVGLWQNEQRELHSQDLMGLMEKIGSGKSDLNDRGTVFALRNAGAIGGEHAGTLLGEIDRQHLKKAEDNVDFTNALNAYRGSTPVDPKDDGMRKGMTQVFNQLAQNMQPGSQEWTNLAADMSRKTGMAPDYALDWSRTKLVSGTNDEAAQAADTVKRLQDANPRGIGFALDDKTKAMASNISKFISGGADAPTAVARARQMDQISPQDEKRLDEIYKAKGQKSLQNAAEPTLNKLIQGDERYQAHGTGWFGTDFRKDPAPAPPISMQAEFESNRSDYFKMTGGDIDQANRLAYEDLKHKWGVTEVNGKREMMQYAPESMNPGLTTPYLREDMIKSAEQFVAASQPNAEYIRKFAPEMAGHYFTPEGQDSKPWEKARLVPDPEATEHSQGQRWQLHVPTANGFYAPLVNPKTGSPWLYVLPSAASSDQAARAAALDKARQDIAHEHEAQKDLIAAQQASAEQGGAF